MKISAENLIEKLEELRNRRGTLRDYLKFSYPLFENPLGIVSMDFRLIDSMGFEKFSQDPAVWQDGRMNLEYVNALKQDVCYNETQESKNVFMFPEHIFGIRSLNYNLWERGESRYRLIVAEQNRELTEEDAFLMKCLAPYICYCVYHEEKAAHTRTDELHELFTRILTDRTADYMEISQRLQRFGWHAEHEYLCLVFQVTYLDERNLTTDAICASMEKNRPGVCSFLFGEEIVTFFDVSKIEEGIEELQNKLKYLIRESYLKAGYSQILKGHGNLRRQYVQARIALHVGGRVSPYLWIHHFDEVAFDYILEQATRRLPGFMLCSERLRKLHEMDEAQGTDYIRTLRCYLDENLSATHAANALYIHRSTFLYRLEKMKEILDTDFSNPNENLYLGLALRLLEHQTTGSL